MQSGAPGTEHLVYLNNQMTAQQQVALFHHQQQQQQQQQFRNGQVSIIIISIALEYIRIRDWIFEICLLNVLY